VTTVEHSEGCPAVGEMASVSVAGVVVGADRRRGGGRRNTVGDAVYLED